MNQEQREREASKVIRGLLEFAIERFHDGWPDDINADERQDAEAIEELVRTANVMSFWREKV